MKTIAKALDNAVKSKKGQDAAAAVVLRAGMYFLKETLNVKAEHSNIKVRNDTLFVSADSYFPREGHEFSWRKGVDIRRNPYHTIVV